MPGVTLHFVIADRALDRWRAADPSFSPFDLDDPVLLNAFHHGAVGPDLGYFPGGDRVLSDLAHCVRTGVLSRQLLRCARTEKERAFALGWLTHVLADQAIHPWIGLGVGALLHGRRDRFVDGSSNLLAHLRVEMGVDAWFGERYPEVRRRRLRVAFDGDEVSFLVRAYAATYGVLVAPELFARSHRATSRRVGQALATLPLLSALTPGTGGLALPSIRWALRTAYGCEPLKSLVLAYLNPVAPEPWLLEGIAGEVATHASTFDEMARSGAATLDDINLDTGCRLADEKDHPGTLRALEGLAELVHGTRGGTVALPGTAATATLRPLGLPAEA